jgi:hypothetical protein
MAGILPVAIRFYGGRFVNGREQGRLYLLYHPEVDENEKVIYTTHT